MPRFVPVNRVADLPPPTSVEAREQYVLDFKETVDPEKWWELAKDVAAFANALGGVILVGVREGPPPSYDGLPLALAERIQQAYEDAAKDRLSPRPIVDAVLIPLSDGRVVVAVNTHPYPDQPIGSQLPQVNRKGEHRPFDAWQFPVRIGRHTRYLVPAMLPMLTNASVRRTVILLESIPRQNTPNYRNPKLLWRHPRNHFSADPQKTTILIEEIDPEKNVLILTPMVSNSRLRVPLNDVEAVWEASDGEWNVRVSGYLPNDREYISNPVNAVFRT